MLPQHFWQAIIARTARAPAEKYTSARQTLIYLRSRGRPSISHADCMRRACRAVLTRLSASSHLYAAAKWTASLACTARACAKMPHFYIIWVSLSDENSCACFFFFFFFTRASRWLWAQIDHYFNAPGCTGIGASD